MHLHLHLCHTICGIGYDGALSRDGICNAAGANNRGSPAITCPREEALSTQIETSLQPYQARYSLVTLLYMALKFVDLDDEPMS